MTCGSSVHGSNALQAYDEDFDLRHRVVLGSVMTYCQSAVSFVTGLDPIVVYSLRGLSLVGSVHDPTINSNVPTTGKFYRMQVSA